jgi:general secretion pathway protein B
MSFILDALRRADAERERERGQLPDLHARSLSARAMPDEAASGLAWPRMAATAAVLLLVGLVAWLFLRTEAPVAQLATAASTSLSAQPTAAAPTPAPPQSPAPPAAVAAPAAPAPVPVARVEAPSPKAEPPVVRAVPAKPVEPVTPPAATPTAPTHAAAPRPAAPSEVAMPALKVGGVMYAETAENRVLVINDQVLREGEALQPGLVLEHIGPKSAKLRWKDQLIDVPY